MKMNVDYQQKIKRSEWIDNTPEFRNELLAWVLNYLEQKKVINWQNKRTPPYIIDEMISRVDLSNRNITVICNLEFLEGLIHRHSVPLDKIYFIADSRLELDVARYVYKVKGIFIPNQNTLEEKLKMLEKKGVVEKNFWDICFTNPDWNNNNDLKIISQAKKIFKEMVIVHPARWAIDIKAKRKQFNNFKTSVLGELKSLEFFNPNPVFNVGLFYPAAIIHIIASGNINDIDVDYFGNVYKVNSIDDITTFGLENWKTIVEPFIEKMRKLLLKNNYESVWQKRKPDIDFIDRKKYYCQLANIRGHVSLNKDEMVKGDFYTMIMEDPEDNKGIRNPDARKDNFLIWEFDTEEERNNFISYLKTDFARFCLASLKTAAPIGYGEMELIPWLDFTQEWDDYKLHKHFDIDKSTQEYIKEFLPDWHKIRK